MARKRTIAFLSAVVLLGLCSWIFNLHDTQWVQKYNNPSHVEVSKSALMSSDRFVVLDEIRSVSRDNVIIVVSINRETIDFAMNWLCCMKRFEIANYVFVTTDDLAYEFLKSMGETVYKDSTFSEQPELARISYIKKILDMGINVLVTGMGVVWLKNPLPILEMEMTQDVHGQEGDNDPPPPLFMLIRASDRTRGVWSEVLIDMERLMIENGVVVTASHAQELLHKHMTRSGVTLHPLPPALVSQGSEYFSDSYTGSPALLLNGDISSLGEQKSRLMRHHLWFVEGAGTSLTCKTETEGNAVPLAEVKVDTGAEVKVDTEAEVKVDTGAQVKVDSGAEVKLDTGAEVKVDTGAEVKLDTGAEVKADSGAEVKADTGAEVKVDTGAEVKLDTGAEDKADSGAEVQVFKETWSATTPKTAPKNADAELKKIIADRRDPDTNTLIVATVNWDFLDFALNWLCSIRRLGLRNYVFYATDERVYEWLLAADQPVYREVLGDDAKVQSVDYGTVAYQQLVLLRARFTLKVLEQGCGVLSADVDAVWLQNPFPHMGTTADVYAQQEKNGAVCAGFLLTRATDGNVRMWREFLNDLEAKVKESIKKGRITFTNQQFVLLTHMKERGTVINRLPKDLFPSGDLFFSDSFTGSPVVVHNNFIIGHDPKMERFQKKQLWWVEGEPGTEFRCEAPEGSDTGAEVKADSGAEVKADSGAEVKLDTGAEAKGDSGAEVQVDSGAEVQVFKETWSATTPKTAPKNADAELKKIIADRRDPDTNTLIVATVNWDFLDFALNWLCSIRRLGLRNYVFYATDERVYEWLLAADQPVYREVLGDDAKVQSVDYGTVAYQQLVLLRARFTLKVLEQGCGVLSADVDAVWLQNPFPHMGTTADVYAQQEKNGAVCAGFLLTRATDGNVRMWREFLNDLEAKVKDSIKKGRITFTNQQFVLLTHMKERGTVINRLPKDLFPSGDLFFSDSFTGSPVVVHNNFIIGHDPKMERFQKKQLWWVEGEPGTEFRCEAPEGSDTGAEVKADSGAEVKADSGAEVKLDTGAEAKGDSGAEVQVDSGAEVQVFKETWSATTPKTAPKNADAELKKIIADRRDPDTNTLIVATVNWDFLDFALNWLCSIRRLGLRNYVFYATDERVYEWLLAADQPVYREVLGDDAKVQSVDYGTVAYQQLVLLRARFTLKVLEQGCGVLSADVDAVWLQNPFPHMGTTADVYAQQEKNGAVCAGFLLTRATDGNVRMWREFLNDLEAKVKESIKKGRITFTNQQFVLLTHMKERGTVINRLPKDLFPSGDLFFSDSFTGSPVVVHNNFIIGHDPKMERFQKKQLWWVEGEPGTGFRCEAPEGSDTGAEVKADSGAEVKADSGAEVKLDTGAEVKVDSGAEDKVDSGAEVQVFKETWSATTPKTAPKNADAELKKIIADRRDPDTNTLIVATVNWDFLDFALNWLCSIRRLGLRNYVFYATDERVYEWLLAADQPVYREVLGDDAKVQSVDYGTVAYQQLVLLRARFTLKVLEQGCGVLSADVDAVWLQNPFPHMGTTADVYAQQEKNGAVCAGFLLTRATDGNVRMWREFLNDLEAKVKESIKKGRITFTNQQFVLLTHMKERGTVINRLPKDLFPSGDLFFSDSFTGSPVVVHNNFIIGHDPKMERFQKKQLWWVEGEPGTGFRCEAPEGSDTGAEDKADSGAEVTADSGAEVKLDTGAEDKADSGAEVQVFKQTWSATTPKTAPKNADAELKKIIADRRDPDTNTLIVATVNWDFLDFALNWLCSIRRLGLRNYVFYATDERVYEWLLAADQPVYREVLGDDAKVQSVDYGTVAYQQLVLLRARFTLKVLEQGCGVLSADVDAVWLQNPFPHMGTTADVYAQQEKNGAVCAGFLLTRATDGNVRMWREFLNDLEAKVKESIKKGRITFTNQQFVLLTHMKERGTVINRLPKDLFPSGDLFFSDSFTGSPVVVHNNFIVGHDPKMERFQKKQLWWVKGDPASGITCEVTS